MSARFDNDELLRRLDNLNDACLLARNQQSKANPTLDSASDVRITTFGKLIHVLNGTSMCLRSAMFAYARPEFWTQLGVAPPQSSREAEEQAKSHFLATEKFVRFACHQAFFSVLESSLRLVMRAVDPVACNQSTDAFKNIYTCLLSRLGLAGRASLLDLMRCIRNTIHNNGFYFHRSWQDETVEHNGQTYRFEIGKPVQRLGWEDLLRNFDEARTLLLDIFTAEPVRKLPSIPDGQPASPTVC